MIRTNGDKKDLKKLGKIAKRPDFELDYIKKLLKSREKKN